MDHVRWLAEPSLSAPTVIAAFTGWNDAGDAASNAARHLVEHWHAEPLAEIDPEEFTDFATVRPHVRLHDGSRRSIVWPTVGMWHARTPGGDVIVMLGPEPALRWRLFCEQVISVITRYDTRLVVSMGALLADVAHSRPVHLIGAATEQALIARFDLQRSRYEGPTGIVGVLHDACARNDIDSASLWAAVPAYASQVPSPKASLALVRRVCEMVGSPVDLGTLPAEADDYERQVTSIVNNDEDLLGYVTRLEGMNAVVDDDDDDEPANPPITQTEVDPEKLMAEVERFLREQPEA